MLQFRLDDASGDSFHHPSQMGYNLTENQKKLARFLVEQVQAGNLPETFHAEETTVSPKELILSDSRYGRMSHDRTRTRISFKAMIGTLDALTAAKMINQDEVRDSGMIRSRICTLTGLIYDAVANNFAEPSPIAGATGRPKLTYVPNTAFILMWMD